MPVLRHPPVAYEVDVYPPDCHYPFGGRDAHQRTRVSRRVGPMDDYLVVFGDEVQDREDVGIEGSQQGSGTGPQSFEPIWLAGEQAVLVAVAEPSPIPPTGLPRTPG
jgi:hypothetical protein